MPIYDYNCEACGHTFEKRLAIADHKQPESEACPNCTEAHVKQTLTAPAICDPVRIGVKKADSTFQKYVLGRMKNSIPGNVLGAKSSITREV